MESTVATTAADEQQDDDGNHMGRPPTLPPIQYKARLPTKAQQKNRLLVVTCNICAKLAGMMNPTNSSSTSKTWLSRDALVEAVIVKLRHQLLPHTPMQPPPPQQPQQPDTAAILSIDAHSSSGQIVVTLRLENNHNNQMDDTSQEGTMGNDDSSQMSLDENIVQEESAAHNTTNDVEDKLAQWYYQETKGRTRLRPDQRELKILTLPAHQSALNPKVHELYIHYQHVVHQDPDPLQTKEGEEDVEGNKGTDMDSAVGGTAAGDPIEEISRLEWGSHFPPHFKEQVTEMLQKYLTPHPQHIQRALLASYFSFYQFLVESPFPFSNDNESTSTTVQEGCFHQQYWIGDVLIAVGVVDILPQGLSSVYLYYHPGMSHSLVALGKLATLKEIEYTRYVLKKPYYYLGYYIESCPKMRYKADYHPSQLLCPVHYEWVDCDKAIPKLQSAPRQVCALVGDPQNVLLEQTTTAAFADSELAQIPMDIGAGIIPVTLDMLHENGKKIVRPILQEFRQAAGPDMSRQCVLNLKS